MSATNLFAHLEMAPPDPILGTAVAFRNDPSPDKVNMGIGAYRTDEGVPYVFQAVREAERRILDDPSVNKEYLPIEGLADFNRLAKELLFGANSPLVTENRVATIQSISGTGALRIAAESLHQFLNPPAIYTSVPTWGNHLTIFQRAGFQLRTYPYWNEATRGLNLDGMLEALREAPEGSVILLHACAHNPTGVDPTPDQWNAIADVIAEKKLIPLVDSAYQGFATGDLEGDAAAIRLFASRGFQMIVTQSFAKNMGMYGERIGALHFVCQDSATAEKLLSQVKIIVRASYSNPPLHGSLVAARILGDPALRESWTAELRTVSERIIAMRNALRGELEKSGCPGDWSHITSQIGMFSYTGLTPTQCDNMINKWHCYMLRNGRISMSGINTKNVEYVARAIKDSVESAQGGNLAPNL